MDKLGPIELDFLLNSPEFKVASDQLKAEITGIVDTAKQAAADAAAATAVVFSDSAKEIEDFQRKLEAAGKMSGPLVESKGIEEANRQLNELVAAKGRLTEFYTAGKMSAEAYQDAVDKLTASERQLTAAVAGQAPNQQGAEVQILDEKQRALSAVADEYRGVLEAGMQAYGQLTPEAQRMIIQLGDMDDEMRMVAGAQANLSKRFDEGKIDANQYTQALAGLSVREAELRKNINETSRSLQGQGQAIAATKPQWNGLGNSINQLTRELPAFTYSAQTGFMAISNNIPILVDEINRLKVTNAAAAASGAATIPIWTAIKAAMFSWMTVISLFITVFTVFGKEIFGFIKGLFDTKTALDSVKASAQALNEAWKSTDLSKAAEQLLELKTNLNLAKEGLLDQKTVLDQYNETIGKSTKEVTTLLEAEQGLVKFADSYIQATLLKAAADAAREKGVKEQIELLDKQRIAEEDLAKAVEKEAQAKKYNFETGRGVGSSAQQAALERVAVEKELEEINKMLTDSGTKTEEIIASFMKKSLGTGVNVIGDQSQFNKITGDIKKINEEYANADLIKTEKEVQNIKDKFAKIRKEAEKFNADPANKANLVDISGLEASEEKAIAEALAKKKTIVDKTISQRQTLLDKIASIDAEYARKSFTKDEEELQALKDKFGKVRELVERFNADPKNQAKRIDLAGLDNAEGQAVGDLLFRQETDMMAAEIANQKKLFADFEEYKAKFGTEKAKEAYGEQIGEYESYMDYLRKLIDENQSTYAAAAAGGGSGGQQERYKILEKAAQEENDLQRKKHQELEAEYQSHAQKMQIRLENYLAARKALEKTSSVQQLAEMDNRFKEESDKLDAAEYKKTESYKRVMQEIRLLTIKQSRELLALAEIELEKYKDNAEARKDIDKQILDLKGKINRGSLENIYQISMALGTLGQSLQNLGESGSAISQIGGLMSGLASGIGDLLTTLDKEASNVDKITAGIGALVNIISMIGRAAAERKESEEAYYLSMIGFQQQYNLSLNEQLRLQSELGESVFLKDFEGRIKSGLTALADANKQYQDSMDKLAGGSVKGGQRNAIDWGNVGTGAASGAAIGTLILPVIGTAIGAVIGGLAGLFAGKKKKDTFLPLLQEYPELIQKTEDGVGRINKELAETLIAQGLLDDETKLLVENVLEWEAAMEAAREQIKGVISELAGSLSSDLRNALVDSFRAGEDAALAMGKTVEKVLEDIISQIIFNKVFADTFKELEEQMAESMDTGGDGNWVDDFQRFFEASKGLSEQWDQAMKDAQAQAAAAGFNIFKPEGASGESKQGLTAGIQRLTESTGNEIAGLQRGTFDVLKRILTIKEGSIAVEMQHYQATLEGLNYWAAIERNTGATVAQLELAVVELKAITKNTKGGQSSYDLGVKP